jgi:hypothetical protein
MQYHSLLWVLHSAHYVLLQFQSLHSEVVSWLFSLFLFVAIYISIKFKKMENSISQLH